VSWARCLAALCFAAGLLASVQAQQPAPAAPASAPKVMRYAFLSAETSFDPARISDLYSRIVTAHVFDALYKYDYLSTTPTVRPNTAAAMPEIADDFKTWTIRIKPGIYFSDDPAFGGKKRELVAADYVYSWKRLYDPVNKCPLYDTYREKGVIGVDELRQTALQNKAPFDYDREVAGLRALDRYTVQFKLDKPNPRFLYILADNSVTNALAREVVEYYKDAIGDHPVGTGPFRLASWRRSSQMVLERNPNFREEFYDGEPAADDANAQALLQKFKGRRLPMLDRVEISVIEEAQPRWLSFVNGEFDIVAPLPYEFAAQVVPNGKLAPHLAKRGIQLDRVPSPDRMLHYYNMEDPIVGGYTPDKVALRRAINLATDPRREIRIRQGQAIPAQTIIAPGTYGYDPHYKDENGDYDLARSKALLDMYGYIDRDGDGWRDLPDGTPLVIEYASYRDSSGRQFAEDWRVALNAINIRLKVRIAQFPEQLKAGKAGQLMIWQLGYTAVSPDLQDALQLLFGPASGGQNLPRFRNAEFDAIYRRMQNLPDGPERLALLREALKIATAYAPMKIRVHRLLNDLMQPWLVGYRHPMFGNQFWQYVDIDESRRNAH
jgi:ABC-type transport system substrate-binding protein